MPIGVSIRPAGGLTLGGKCATIPRVETLRTGCGGEFLGADFEGADLTEADLKDASFERCNLRGANFEGADLQHADLYDADAMYANFRGANLHGANLWFKRAKVEVWQAVQRAMTLHVFQTKTAGKGDAAI